MMATKAEKNFEKALPNIEENVGLRLAEEGAKEAFGHVVQQKRDLDAECKRLRGLLDLAYDTIRRKSHNAEITGG